MTVKRHVTEQSCCASPAYIFETDKPVKKSHLPALEDAGFWAPPQYVKVGVFYVQKDALIATCAFGNTLINVRCSGKNCDALLNAFEAAIDKVVSS